VNVPDGVATNACAMRDELLALLRANDGAFWPALGRAVEQAGSFEELTALASLKKGADER